MKLGSILDEFKEKEILVIGDIMLDRYIEGDVSRINPEAPVPVVNVEKEYYELGGAGNVVSNIVALGGKATLFSFAGDDPAASILKQLMEKRRISYFLERDNFTIEKTRILGRGQQLLRFDKENCFEKKFGLDIKKILLEKAEKARIIIISDYAKGTVTNDLMNLLSHYKSKMIVDPKPKNKELYKDVFLIKPNEKETLEMSFCQDSEEAGRIIKQELNSHVLITRGKKGMILFSDKVKNIPSQAREVYDVTGAGDTVVAVLALAIAAGSSLEDAAVLANSAAGIAIEKKGTYHVGLQELKSKIFSEENKIVNLEALQRIIEDCRKKNKKIVWTNGCFDILHIGHINYLKEAKNLGDVLIVGLNSDSSIEELKGADRPIQTEGERAEILASLKFVDYILIFPELSVEKYIKELKPEIYVKGGDYNLDTINQKEKDIVEEYGGQIKFLSLVGGKSTSNIIERIQKNNPPNKN